MYLIFIRFHPWTHFFSTMLHKSSIDKLFYHYLCSSLNTFFFSHTVRLFDRQIHWQMISRFWRKNLLTSRRFKTLILNRARRWLNVASFVHACSVLIHDFTLSIGILTMLGIVDRQLNLGHRETSKSKIVQQLSVDDVPELQKITNCFVGRQQFTLRRFNTFRCFGQGSLDFQWNNRNTSRRVREARQPGALPRG